MIREMRPEDSSRVLEIYGMGIASRHATFETRIPAWEEWNAGHLSHSRLVFLHNHFLVGWAALSPVSKRKVYEGVAEVSLYMDKDYTGQGIGKLLLREIIDSSEKNGIWTLFSATFPENLVSIKLQLACGFRQVGIRERIACLDGVWKDTIILERRSKTVGV